VAWQRATSTRLLQSFFSKTFIYLKPHPLDVISEANLKHEFKLDGCATNLDLVKRAATCFRKDTPSPLDRSGSEGCYRPIAIATDALPMQKLPIKNDETGFLLSNTSKKVTNYTLELLTTQKEIMFFLACGAFHFGLGAPRLTELCPP
jgi:hypothetical protein